MWRSNDSIALVQLIFYIPFLFLSVFVCFRHGFHRSSGWIYTLVLCTIRIVGGACQFKSHNNPSASLLQTILVLDSVGLSPLLLATLGLLSRFIDFINAKSTPRFTVRHFRVLQLVLFLGMILGIVGGTSISVSANGSIQVPTTSKVGVILYIVGFVGMSLVHFLSVTQTIIVPNKERRMPLAITLALPFLLVRLVYSILSIFVQGHLFSIATGNVSVRIAMSIIEEFVVVAMYILLGLLVDKVDAAHRGPIANRPWNGKTNKGNRGAWDDMRGDVEAQPSNSYPVTIPPAYLQSNGVVR
jgi:hypothetical protein